MAKNDGVNKEKISLIEPINNSVVDVYTDVQKEFINLIKEKGSTCALDWLFAIKNGRELSYPAPVRLSWKENGDRYLLEISETENFFEPYIVKTDKPFYDVENLKIGQTYYWRVNGCDAFSFKTSSNGYRFVKIDGALNVRDLGGINIKQGLLFRGSDVKGEYEITEQGVRTWKEQLKIKTELNIRKEKFYDISESLVAGGVRYKYLPYRPYLEIFEQEHRKGIVDIMEFLADENNYPIYYHCLGGADRTGMIALFLRGLLGESDEDILIDYELTSLSSYAYGLAEGATTAGFRSRYHDYFQEFLSVFNTYKGNSLGEKAENFLLECGVKNETISKIRKILAK